MIRDLRAGSCSFSGRKTIPVWVWTIIGRLGKIAWLAGDSLLANFVVLNTGGGSWGEAGVGS